MEARPVTVTNIVEILTETYVVVLTRSQCSERDSSDDCLRLCSMLFSRFNQHSYNSGSGIFSCNVNGLLMSYSCIEKIKDMFSQDHVQHIYQ